MQTVQEDTGSGLVIDKHEGKYTLRHMASGYTLASGVESLWEAQRWLELVTPLYDWTQSAQAIRQQGAELPRQVVAYRNQAEEEARCLWPLFIGEAHWKLIRQKAVDYDWTYRKMLQAMIDFYCKTPEELAQEE